MEREEINSSTADTENTHVGTNNGTDSTSTSSTISQRDVGVGNSTSREFKEIIIEIK